MNTQRQSQKLAIKVNTPERCLRPDGTEEWWLNEQRHRKDGPAITHPDGSKEWYLNGKPHREDGPSYITPNGYQQWFLNGVLHREDGPAIIESNGTKRWYLNGKRIYSEGYNSMEFKTCSFPSLRH